MIDVDLLNYPLNKRERAAKHMKNTFGNSVSVTIFGESHGSEIGVVLDGLAPGIQVNEDEIAEKLRLRRPSGSISTKRVEPDHFRIVSGVFNGATTGTPVCILIPNENTKSKDLYQTPQGYYVDDSDVEKCLSLLTFLPMDEVRRLSALEGKGILIGTHIARCAGIPDRGFMDLQEDIRNLSGTGFAVLDNEAAGKMREAMEQAAKEGDSVGGILETAVTGLPAGIGEPWFDSLESVLSHALFSIPAVKGVEFGDGFALSDLRGSDANDCFAVQDGRITTRTNHNGGINGGISNGMPLLFRCAVKPTPSIYKEQDTADFFTQTEKKIVISGRHDPAIVHRARIVADCVTALVLCDVLAQRYGTDYLAGDGE